MTQPLAPAPDPDEPEPLFPQTRGEFITVLAHYHRAEIARMDFLAPRIVAPFMSRALSSLNLALCLSP